MVHHIGLVVFTVTTGSSGRRWFEVDTIPSNDDICSAIQHERKEPRSLRHCINSLRFHLRPVVVRTVESMPTGRRPQVGPKAAWSIAMRCSP